MMTTSYRGNPEALSALVQPDRVHRDLYISQEVFELEQENFFANTWNYIGHDSQVPKPGDYITNEIGGRPLIVVRHSEGVPGRRLGFSLDQRLTEGAWRAGEELMVRLPGAK